MRVLILHHFITSFFENQVETTSELLRYAADHTISFKVDNTILHLAAIVAKISTLAVLTKARMRGLNIEARNAKGFTANELTARRHEMESKTFPKAFNRLVQSIVDEKIEGGSWTSINSAESWHRLEDTCTLENEPITNIETDCPRFD